MKSKNIGCTVNLSKNEIERYNRHLLLPGIGVAGQEKLVESRVLCIGSGGLGSPVLLYLAAAGVGRLGIMDFDVVDVSNLQRQIIFSTQSVGKSKVESASQKIHELNPQIKTDRIDYKLTKENALDLFSSYDVIVDCTDNFPARYLINDACELTGKPNVYGSIFRFEGQVSVFNYAGGPGYRDLFPEPPEQGLVPDCATAGVLGILPGLIGTIQATEVIKVILGIGNTLSGRLLLYDALKMTFREIKIPKDNSRQPVIELVDYSESCNSQAETMQSQEINPQYEISASSLANELQTNNVLLIDVREPMEWDICHIPGATLIPLGELDDRLNELDTQKQIIAYCRTGIRTLEALRILHEAGFSTAKHLHGGIYAWSDEVDPTVPKY
ncbi:molybdopterin-synthase adenylyltransferase MoeB [candidate division KSB1 bacterium]|nr:molybdopterin-synthase adenylyltransferase MoeB [candidate division KSB1 bacterium]